MQMRKSFIIWSINQKKTVKTRTKNLNCRYKAKTSRLQVRLWHTTTHEDYNKKLDIKTQKNWNINSGDHQGETGYRWEWLVWYMTCREWWIVEFCAPLALPWNSGEDYFPMTAHREVFYSSSSTAVIHLFLNLSVYSYI